jgi:hypothetical protein
LRRERAAITESRTIGELDIALAVMPASVGRAWDRSDQCRHPDDGDLGRCRRTIDLRQARARAEQRNHVDQQIADLEGSQVGIAIISTGDPGAAFVASLAGVDEAAVRRRLRLTLLTVLPATAGVLLSLATALQGSRRCAG